jgi:alpha-ketoglutarate-dependent taurine dioxygenase
LIDETHYAEWREARLESYPRSAEELLVEIGGLRAVSGEERAAIRARCARGNMVIYRCRDTDRSRLAIREFGAGFGLRRLDHHLCTNADGVSELAAVDGGVRSGYAPYSRRSLSWHTDGYYNDAAHQVRAVILHCVSAAASGGENALLDPEIAYIRLRDENPAFITALEHPGCMAVPANTGPQGEIRPEVCGPVFSRDPGSGKLHMRYSARKRNIRWRDDALTRTARDCLTEILTSDPLILRYRLQPGEGLISNNVLHNRTAFEDSAGHHRLFYRARYYERVGGRLR